MGRGMDLKERATSEKSDFQKVGLLKGGGGVGGNRDGVLIEFLWYFILQHLSASSVWLIFAFELYS